MFPIKKLFFIIILVFSNLQGFCQDSISFKIKNTFYLEVFGNTPNYSINYDRILWFKNKLHIGARAGIGIWYLKYFNETIYKATPNMLTWNCPIEVYSLYGKNKHFLETSAGYTYSTAKYLFAPPNLEDPIYVLKRYRTYFVGRLGYRFQNKNGGFVLRTGLTLSYNTNPWGPSINPYEYATLSLFGGLNLGWSF